MYEIRFICLKISKLFVFYSILNLFFLTSEWNNMLS